jgi:hypothetical protein
VTEVPEPPVPHQPDADNVVEQAVERAAVKVAAAATPSNGPLPVLSKIESIGAVAIIVVIGMVNLAMNVITKNDLAEHRRDFKAVCEIIVQQAPPENAKNLAIKLSECLH